MSSSKTLYTRIQNKIDTLANYVEKDPILFDGEIILIDDNNTIKIKIGQGKKFSETEFINQTLETSISELQTLIGDTAVSEQISSAINSYEYPYMTLKLGGESLLPSSQNWSDVTYGNGKFVTVARNSDIAAYSIDGINWTTTTLPKSGSWCSVAYGNGKFVALGGYGSAIYSTDGINWILSPTMSSQTYWNDIVYANEKFVAVGNSPDRITYSTDGINWTIIDEFNATSLWSITYGNNKFIALPNNGDDVGVYSTDGINWESITLPIGMYCYSVAYGNGMFVAVNYSGENIYSTDGINWETLKTLKAGYYSIIYENNKFVAISTNAEVAYSSDGIIWSYTNIPNINFSLFSHIAYGNGKFVVVSKNTDKVVYSSDGIAWNSAIEMLGEDVTNDVKSLLSSNGGFIDQTARDAASAAQSSADAGAVWLPPNWPRNTITDLLNIYTTGSQDADLHRPEFFGSESPATDFTSCPYTSGPFYGYRMVYKPTTHLTMVELHEVYPALGRVWTNTYDVNAGAWLGWMHSMTTAGGTFIGDVAGTAVPAGSWSFKNISVHTSDWGETGTNVQRIIMIRK